MFIILVPFSCVIQLIGTPLLLLEPPSAPREVTSDDVKGMAQNVTWKAPILDGGRDDLFYNVTAYGTENTVSNDQPITDMSYLLEGLIPLSLYLVVVTAENGVSDQDGNIDQRSVSRTVFTAEAGKITAGRNGTRTFHVLT